MKVSNKRELQQIAINHSSVIGFKHFIKLYKKCTKKLYSLLVNNKSVSSDSSLFRKNIKSNYND